MIKEKRILDAAFAFDIPNGSAYYERLPGGHINMGYRVRLKDTPGPGWTLQRINKDVFGDLSALTENTVRITQHLTAAREASGELALEHVPCRAGGYLHVEEDGHGWRMFKYVDDAVCYEEASSAEQAYKCAQAFGRYQVLLDSLPAPALHSVIPGFHDTPARLGHFRESVSTNVRDRVSAAAAEIAFVDTHDNIAGLLDRDELPTRIAHYDAKIGNLLFDVETDEAICVIDLDTTMPGLGLFDFGDLARSCCASVSEDAGDVDVGFRMDVYEALAAGFRDGAAGLLTPQELHLLPESALVITFECGMRFLTDYLNGDVYFRIEHDQQNLLRAQTQFALAREFAGRLEELRLLVV